MNYSDQGLSVTVGTRRYTMSNRLLVILAIGGAITLLGKIVIEHYLHASTLALVVAHAVPLGFGAWVGLNVDIDDADPDDIEDEITSDGEALS
jgi:hypothetical protein